AYARKSTRSSTKVHLQPYQQHQTFSASSNESFSYEKHNFHSHIFTSTSSKYPSVDPFDINILWISDIHVHFLPSTCLFKSFNMAHEKSSSSDPFEVLGVTPNACSKDIKTAYHKLCLQFHPDKAGPESHEKFVQIQEAYDFLYDAAQKREQHKMEKPQLSGESKSSPQAATSEDGGSVDDYQGAHQYYYDEDDEDEQEQEDNDDNDEDNDVYDDTEFSGDEEDYHGAEEESTPGSEFKPHWYQKQPDKKPAQAEDPLTQACNRTRDQIKTILQLLGDIEDHIDYFFQCIEANYADKFMDALWIRMALGHAAVLWDPKMVEAERAEELIKGTPDSEWATKPEVMMAVNSLDRLGQQARTLDDMMTGLDDAYHTVEATQNRVERERLKQMFEDEALATVL
ncbi:hypothetical protein F4805DRAFT_477592, partial [Annulohypoxylon moriforme]